jgi:glycosyltransferase involved in cell wall biosynthesis
MDTNILRVATLYDYEPGSTWVETLRGHVPPIELSLYSALPGPFLRRIPGPNWGRIRAALALRSAVRRRRMDMVASQVPFNTHYAASIAMRGAREISHIAFSFNFTDLPSGVRLNAMRRSLPRVDRFCVFTEVERSIYSNLFELPIERFHFQRWSVSPPIESPAPRTIAEPYIIAIGGEARDYATLAETARLMPTRRFVAVARPNSFDGIAIPDNLTLLVNRPWHETWSLAVHAEAMLVPLRSSETPNGIVSIVGAMYMGIPLIVTDSTGVHDYLQQDETALLVPVRDSSAFVRAIERLEDEAGLADRLAAAAQAFANTHCSEQSAADFALAQITDLAKSGMRS